jgi:hypothetical protein
MIRRLVPGAILISCVPVDAPRPQSTAEPAAAPSRADATEARPKPSPAPRDALRTPEGEAAYFLLDGAFVQLDRRGFDTLTVDEPLYSLQVAKSGRLHAVTIPPCAESRPSFVATSDTDGRFAIEGLPVGIWSLTVQRGGEWRLLNRGLDPFRVAAGDETDLGELDATRGMLAIEERKRRR